MININVNYEAKKDTPMFGLVAGGYQCKIVNAVEKESRNGNPMLELFLDIADGDYQDFYSKKYKEQKENNPDAKWQCRAFIVIPSADAEEKSFLVRNFKNFIYAVESSNKGYSLISNGGIDAKTLRGKLIGYTFGEEEYLNRDNEVKCSVKPNKAYAIADIVEGNFAIPKRKCVEVPEQAEVINGFAGDDELPF